jgi:hypothetical protein
MLDEIRSTKPEILASIRDEKQLTPANEGKLKEFLDSFSKAFA